MNELIKELYEQAHLVYEIPYESSVVDSTIVSTYKRRQFDPKKFAELIVKECAGIYDKIDNGNLHMGTDDYLEALHKTFFGVEE